MLHSAVFWLWVSMAVFLFAAGKPVARGIAGILDRKRDSIRLQLEEATRLCMEAEALLAASQQKQAEALATAERILADAKEDAARIRTEASEKLKKSLAVREQQALDKIAEAEASATREAKNLAAALALAASREVLLHGLSPATADQLVEQAIAEIPAKVA